MPALTTDMQNVEKQFDVSKESLPVIQDFIAVWCEQNCSDMKASNKIAISADEIISNVVYYSGASFIKINCSKAEDLITIVFTDNGKAFDPLTEAKEPDITASAEEREIGGLGIFMVKKMMNSVDYKRSEDMNVLTISIKV